MIEAQTRMQTDSDLLHRRGTTREACTRAAELADENSPIETCTRNMQTQVR